MFYADDDGPGDYFVGVWYLPSEIVAPVTSTIRRGGWISYYKDGNFIHALKGTVSVWTIAVGSVNEDDVFVHVLEDTFEYTV
ncbi:MAG: hypothetical protein RBS49_10570, partial [Sphaerochaeta sp.]|nr:hypothetical protein [Sphaerochaeta sp.]